MSIYLFNEKKLIKVNEKKYIELLEEALHPQSRPDYELRRYMSTSGIERGMKIIKVIEKYTSLSHKKVLDIGCATAGISIAFAKRDARIVGLDITRRVSLMAKRRTYEEGVNVPLLLADGENMPFFNESFEIVVCNNIIEHVPHPKKLVDEIERVLKPGGILFLSAPNKISPISILSDPHYNLFGVSLLPPKISDFYVTAVRKRAKSGKSGLWYMPTYWGLIKMFKEKNIELHSVSNENIKNKIEDPPKVLSKRDKLVLDAINKFHLKSVFSNDGFLNFITPFIPPTFWFIGKKR